MGSPRQQPAPSATERLVVDTLQERLDRIRRLSHTDSAEADRALEELGVSGTVERDIVAELADRRPLAHPNHFAAAHSLAMRSLEVLDRNGTRDAQVNAPGPLDPVAQWAISVVTTYVVRTHQSTVVEAIRNLYARREAACLPGAPELAMLGRARRQVDRIAPGFKRQALALPTALFGGAVVGPLTTLLSQLNHLSLSLQVLVVLASAATSVLLLGGSWAVLRGAAVARKRIRLTTDAPLAALWETIGQCGRPPRDEARTFAFVAVVLTLTGWLVLVVAVVLAVVSVR